MGYVADFRCKRCLEGDSAPVVLLSEVELEPGVKVECVSKFCYLGDKRCLKGDSAPVVLLSEVELEPGVKVECVSKFCYLGDTVGSCSGSG